MQNLIAADPSVPGVLQNWLDRPDHRLCVVVSGSSLHIANLGPFEPAQRYWRGNAPEHDVVARSIDGRRLLVGEAEWPAGAGAVPVSRIGRIRQAVDLPGATSSEIVHVLFAPDARKAEIGAGVVTVDARTVMAVLR